MKSKPFLGEAMIVYRVEKNGVGPYRDTQVDLQAMYNRHNFSHKHKPPVIDCGRDPEEEEVCGFDSLQKLQRWFHGFRLPLKRLGFKIYVYEAEPTIEGNQQLLFKDKESILIKTLVLR